MVTGTARTSVGRPSEPPTDYLSRSTPDGVVYWSPEVYEKELDGFFLRNWLCVAREEDLPNPGDFLTRAVGNENVLLIRDGKGKVGAFYNVCRHRGTPVVPGERGTGAHSFTCPYHSWVYALDGRLTGAPHTKELENFRKEEFGLYRVRLDRWGGFLWVNFDDRAEPLEEAFGELFARFARFPIASLRLGARKVYDVKANWKILVENYSECYHCAPVHPSLNRLTPYLSGENDATYFGEGVRRKFAGGYMTFAKDYTSMTRSGYTQRPPLSGMTKEDRQRVYYYTLFPNLFFSLHPDYLMIHRTWPSSPGHSTVENEFYFAPDIATAPGFDPSDAVEIWDEVNRQDWYVCELAQRGTRSKAWHGGRYSEQESLVCDFDRYVEEEMRRLD